MQLTHSKAKRFMIYVFHDSQGIVDQYVATFLLGLREHVQHILVVVNGEVNDDGKCLLEKHSDEILIRENTGYDITGYRIGLEHMQKMGLESFDEYILANSTLYGPIYPFSEMFGVMNNRNLDFWGITKHHKVDFDVFGTCKYGYIPEHIQSSFLVIRRSLFQQEEYINMWKQLPEIHDYAEAIGFFEVIFTKEFNEKGYLSDVYVDTSDLEGFTRYPLLMMSDELVINRRCPVMKQKSYSQNYYDILMDTVGNSSIDSFEYIRDYTDYDTNQIWDNILRIYNIADIKNLLHFNYILSAKHSHRIQESEEPKIALMMHLYYPDLVDKCMAYANNMPENSDLIITTPNKETYDLVQSKLSDLLFREKRVLLIENRGRDVSSLLVACAPFVNNYDYVCFMHDKKTTQLKPYANGESFAYKCFENCLGSNILINNILETFESNPRLGMLMPPPPNHGNLYQTIGQEWASNYDNTMSLAHELRLGVNIYWNREPISPLGTMFWFRPKAMHALFAHGWEYSDFPREPNGFDGTLLHAVERIYGYVVQHEGYFPAWVMSDKFARIEVTNLNFMLRELTLRLITKYPTQNLLDMTQKMESNLEFKWTKNMGIKELIKKLCPKFIWNFLKIVKTRFAK